MEAPSILLDNSLTGFVISGLLCLVRYNKVCTPDLYMDCVFSSTLEISSTFPPIVPGVPGEMVIFFFATLSPNCFSKLLIIVGCPNQAFLPSSLCNTQIIFQTYSIFNLKMTLQYFNCSIKGFFLANDQYIINVNNDDTNPSFIFSVEHAWISIAELKTCFLHLVNNCLPNCLAA